MRLRLVRPALALAALVVLVLAGCAFAVPSRALLTVRFDGATPEALDAAALVLGERLLDAGVPVVDSRVTADGVEISLGRDATDSDLEFAQSAAADLSSSSEFRPVIAVMFGDDVGFDLVLDEEQPPPLDGSDLGWITPEVAARFSEEDCTGDPEPEADPSAALVACDVDGTLKYVLGPRELNASSVVTVTADPISGTSGVSIGEWGVNLQFDAAGTDGFAEITTRLVGLESPRNQFAILLDGRVLSAPVVLAAITDGAPQISGDVDEQQARVLAARLLLAAAGLRPVSIDLVEE